jgi:hypothetical protein
MPLSSPMQCSSSWEPWCCLIGATHCESVPPVPAFTVRPVSFFHPFPTSTISSKPRRNRRFTTDRSYSNTRRRIPRRNTGGWVGVLIRRGKPSILVWPLTFSLQVISSSIPEASRSSLKRRPRDWLIGPSRSRSAAKQHFTPRQVQLPVLSIYKRHEPPA